MRVGVLIDSDYLMSDFRLRSQGETRHYNRNRCDPFDTALKPLFPHYSTAHYHWDLHDVRRSYVLPQSSVDKHPTLYAKQPESMMRPRPGSATDKMKAASASKVVSGIDRLAQRQQSILEKRYPHAHRCRYTGVNRFSVCFRDFHIAKPMETLPKYL